MTTLPRRARRATSVLSSRARGARHRARPRRRRRRRDRRRSRAKRAPRPGSGAGAAAGADRRGARRSSRSGGTCSRRSSCRSPPTARRSLVVKFNDYQCPPCRLTHEAYKPVLPKYARHRPGQVRPQALSARAGVQPERAERQPFRVVRSGGGRRAWRKTKGSSAEARGLALRAHSPPADARAGRRTPRARSAASPTSTRSIRAASKRSRPTPAWAAARRELDADLLHQRPPVPPSQILAPQYFDAFDRDGAEAGASPQSNGHASGDPHRGAHQGLRGRVLAEAAVPRARSPDARRSSRARSSASSVPNGAGKTTTLKLLMQLIFPTSGRAEILGRPVGDVATRQRIGYLPENPYFYDYLTAEELLTYFAQLFGYAPARARTRVSALLDRVGIGARAPAAAAQVLEGDDAARRHRAGAPQRSRGDLSRRADVRASIRSAAATSASLILELRDQGRTVFFSSHILADAEALCSRVAVVAGGRLAATGRLSDILAFEVRGWELVVADLTPDVLARMTPPSPAVDRDLARPLRARAVARRRRPSACCTELDGRRRQAGVAEPGARHARGLLRASASPKPGAARPRRAVRRRLVRHD